MTLASGANVGLSYVEETTQGETPTSPTMKTLRSTGFNINPSRNTLTSNERRSDRQRADMRHGFRSVTGNVPAELTTQDQDDMIQAAFSGTWTAGTSVASTSLDVTSASDGGSYAGGSGEFSGIKVGDIVDFNGFTNSENNGQKRIKSISADESTVTVDAALVDESGDGDETADVVGQTLDIGSTLRTFTFERRFTDISQYQVYKGVAVNGMDVSIQPENIVTLTYNFLGLQAENLTGSSLGTPEDPTANKPYSAFEGAVWIDGAEIAIVTGLDFSLANNRTTRAVVGSYYSPEVFEGEAIVTGTATVFLEDATLFSHFHNEDEVLLQVKLDDINGTDFENIVMNRVKFTAGDMDPPQEGPITINLPFQALVDVGNTDTTLRWQRSNA